MTPRIEHRDIHGDGGREYELYTLPGDNWSAITNVPCPVEGCDQTLVWYEAGYVPGYRVCMAPLDDERIDDDRYDAETLRHRFVLLDSTTRKTTGWTLVRDACCEKGGAR